MSPADPNARLPVSTTAQALEGTVNTGHAHEGPQLNYQSHSVFNSGCSLSEQPPFFIPSELQVDRATNGP